MNSSDYCSVRKKCSGCQLSNLDYKGQLRYKQNQLRLRFNRLCPLEKILPSALSLHYRNKAQFVFKEDRQKGISGGIYQSADRTVLKTQSCALHTKEQNDTLRALTELLREYRIKPYDFHKGKGSLKNAVVRQSEKTGELMVILVCSAKNPLKIWEEFAQKLSEKMPQISSVILTKSSSYLLSQGENPKVIFGKEKLIDSILGFDFQISYNSFFQINRRQTENLYRKALEFAELKGEETVLDAYCGTGTIGILASGSCKRVLGVEQVENAVKDAKINAALNSVNNIEFVCDDAEKYMQRLKSSGQRVDVAFLDPPRAGCSMSFLRSLAKASPEKIVYISCNIDTQLRDVRFLRKLGYKPKKAQGVDMFPYTKHIECVMLLERHSE